MLDDSGRGRGCSGRRKEKSAFNKLIIASLRWTCICLLKYWHNLLLSTLYHTTASGSRKGCMWCCSLGNYPSAGICTCHEIYSKLQRDPAKINLKAKLPNYFKCELSICISNAFIWIVFMRRASLLTHKHLSSGDRQLSLSINTSQASPYCLWTLLHPSPIRPRDFETEANSLAEVEEEPFKDEHRACAAENSQGLTSQHAEHCSCQCRAHETLQHSLQDGGGKKTKKQAVFTWTLIFQ